MTGNDLGINWTILLPAIVAVAGTLLGTFASFSMQRKLQIDKYRVENKSAQRTEKLDSAIEYWKTARELEGWLWDGYHGKPSDVGDAQKWSNFWNADIRMTLIFEQSTVDAVHGFSTALDRAVTNGLDGENPAILLKASRNTAIEAFRREIHGTV